MHAGQRDFLVSGGGRPADVLNDLVWRLRSAAAACRRDDAVAALLVAAGLDSQGERRTTRDARYQRASTGAVPSGESVPVEDIAGDGVEEFVLAAVRHDVRDVRQQRDVLRRPSRITAGHDHACRRIAAYD